MAKKPVKTVLEENDNGVIYRYSEIPHRMFNFYILKKAEYKNGKCLWHLCVEIGCPADGKEIPSCVNTDRNYIKIGSFRGTKDGAAKRLDEIIGWYK